MGIGGFYLVVVENNLISRILWVIGEMILEMVEIKFKRVWKLM